MMLLIGFLLIFAAPLLVSAPLEVGAATPEAPPGHTILWALLRCRILHPWRPVPSANVLVFVAWHLNIFWVLHRDSSLPFTITTDVSPTSLLLPRRHVLTAHVLFGSLHASPGCYRFSLSIAITPHSGLGSITLRWSYRLPAMAGQY